MDIRETLDLLESKEKSNLKQIKLPYPRSGLSPVMSSALLDLHYGKLYKGYVDRFNKGEGDKTFNEAGAYLPGKLVSFVTGKVRLATLDGDQILGAVGPNGLDSVNGVLEVVVPQGGL